MLRDKHGRKLTPSEIFSKIIIRIKTVWLELVTGFLWWGVGWLPSHHLRRFFYRLAGMKIGRGSSIHMMVRVYDPTNIQIGEDTIIGEKTTLDGRKQVKGQAGGLVIGDHVDVAADAMIWTSQHDIRDEYFSPIEAKVEIEDYVFIGPRAIILPGVKVGKGAIVAAGAVVTKDVQPGDVVAGVPAKKVNERGLKKYDYKLGRARWFQ